MDTPPSSTGTLTPIPSEIAEFFTNKSVFITGATGFLGKTLVEKLLRSCYEIDKIYLLVRQKKGKTPNERLEELTNCKLFEKVKKLHPDYKRKLIAINGDLTESELGISQSDRETLVNNVNIVYHSAATVRFDEPMKVAVNMNIIGVKKIIDLCKQMKNVESIVHISTAYANCDRHRINEEVYNPPVKAEKLIEACEWIQEDVFNIITPKVIQKKPNTYTYTKQIAESVIIQECKDMPVSIIRPSIIGATWREPFPGWVENFNGPTALFPATGTGVLRSMLGKHEAIADIIPVDITVNLMLAVAWYNTKKSSKKMLVFNNTSGQINKFTWGDLEVFGRAAFEINPFANPFFLPDANFTSNRLVKFSRVLFEQLIPAYTIDFFLTLIRKKAFFVRIQKKISKAVEILEFFTTKQWEFTNDNIFMLLDELNETDTKLFNFDIKELDWRSYIETYCLGTKIHLMKEDISKIGECRLKIAKMKRIKKIVLGGLFIIFFKFVLMRSRYVGSIIQFIISLVLRFGKNLANLINFNTAAKVKA